MSDNRAIAEYVMDVLQEKINSSGHGVVGCYAYDEKHSMLIIDIAFRGWYSREKIIDNIYRQIPMSGGILVGVETTNVRLIWKEKGKYISSPIFGVHINWRNLEPNDEVPDIMKNLLSGVSYEEYKTFSGD